MARYAMVVVVDADDAETARRTIVSDTDQLHVAEEVVFVGEPWEVEPAVDYDNPISRWARCNACGRRWDLA